MDVEINIEKDQMRRRLLQNNFAAAFGLYTLVIAVYPAKPPVKHRFAPDS